MGGVCGVCIGLLRQTEFKGQSIRAGGGKSWPGKFARDAKGALEGPALHGRYESGYTTVGDGAAEVSECSCLRECREPASEGGLYKYSTGLLMSE